MRSDRRVTVHFGVDGTRKLTRSVRDYVEIRVRLGTPGQESG